MGRTFGELEEKTGRNTRALQGEIHQYLTHVEIHCSCVARKEQSRGSQAPKTRAAAAARLLLSAPSPCGGGRPTVMRVRGWRPNSARAGGERAAFRLAAWVALGPLDFGDGPTKKAIPSIWDLSTAPRLHVTYGQFLISKKNTVNFLTTQV
jgi:hypothetical protein